ncbi:hypothetical protein NC651_038448 [Populus alba x Populus x berolinensis]|nr:hypothetical protein NC651_038448 [Populus alba x Populus x berolinensis]
MAIIAETSDDITVLTSLASNTAVIRLRYMQTLEREEILHVIYHYRLFWGFCIEWSLKEFLSRKSVSLLLSVHGLAIHMVSLDITRCFPMTINPAT